MLVVLVPRLLVGLLTALGDYSLYKWAGRQEGGGPPPRSYSEFMRNLAAKYNTDTSPE